MASVFLAGAYGAGSIRPHMPAPPGRAGGAAANRLEEGPLRVSWLGPTASSRRSCGVACVLDGEVFNRGALARSVDLPADTPAAAVLAVLYARRGESVLTDVEGEFALVIWSMSESSGLLARDRLGARPLFLSRSGSDVVFASEVRDVVAALPRRPDPDRESVARLLVDGRGRPGRTLHAGVQALEPGHLLRLGGEGGIARAYWRPRYQPPTPLHRDEAAKTLLAGISRSVRARVAGSASSAILLSGGLDSSVVAALAARDAHGPAPRAYCALFPDHPGIDEERHVAAVARSCGLPVMAMRLRGGSAVAGLLGYLAAWGEPSPSPNYFVWAPLLERAAADGTDVLLEGHGGDELFGLDGWLIADRLRQLDVRGAVGLARAIPGLSDDRHSLVAALLQFGVRGALPVRLHRLLRRLRRFRHGASPSVLRPAVAARIRDGPDEWAWKERSGPRWWSHLAHLLTNGATELGVFDYLRRRSVLAGLRARQPLMDAGLVEIVLGLDPALAFDGEMDRPLLRYGARGIVPDSIRCRRDKPAFNAVLDESLLGPDLGAVRKLLGEGARVAEWVEPRFRAELLAGPRGPAGSRRWGMSVWRMLAAECWLRAQEDPGFPERAALELRLQAPDVRFEEWSGPA